MSEFLQFIVNGIQLGSFYALIALGYTMVYGVLRLINFAHGDVFMIGAFVGFFAADALHLHEQPTFAAALLALIPVLIVTMLVCALLGLLIERLAYRPLRRAPRLTALITAIGVSLFLENAMQIYQPNPQRFPNVTPQHGASLKILGATMSWDQLIVIVTAAVLAAVLWYLVQRTRIGKAMRAVSFDADAAALMGINTDTVISFTFGLGAALAGAAGVLFAALTYAQITPLMGISMGLKAFVAAVVGGIGSLPGAMLGGLLMGLAESVVSGSPFSRWTDVVAFVLLIIVLLVRPAGLLGRSAPEKV